MHQTLCFYIVVSTSNLSVVSASPIEYRGRELGGGGIVIVFQLLQTSTRDSSFMKTTMYNHSEYISNNKVFYILYLTH